MTVYAGIAIAVMLATLNAIVAKDGASFLSGLVSGFAVTAWVGAAIDHERREREPRP